MFIARQNVQCSFCIFCIWENHSVTMDNSFVYPIATKFGKYIAPEQKLNPSSGETKFQME